MSIILKTDTETAEFRMNGIFKIIDWYDGIRQNDGGEMERAKKHIKTSKMYETGS